MQHKTIITCGADRLPVAHDEKHLHDEQDRAESEGCGVQMQRARARYFCRKPLAVQETEAEQHSYPKNTEPDC